MSACCDVPDRVVIRCASRWYFCAKPAIDFGTVAENISVRRSCGHSPRIYSRSSRKPRSNISSASSNTTPRIADRSIAPRMIWSRKRPGVATTICAPRSRVRRSSRMSMPPTQEAMTTPAFAYSQPNSRFTCIANSRVGAMIKASGAPAATKASPSPSSVPPSARPKPTVLPDPVWADTKRSAPSRAGSVTACCTGVSVSYPRRASASARVCFKVWLSYDQAALLCALTSDVERTFAQGRYASGAAGA